MAKSKIKYLALSITVLVLLFMIFIMKKSDSLHTEFYLSKRRAQTIQQALSEYKKNCGSYPSSEDGLTKLKINNDSCGYIAGDDIKASNGKDANGENYIYSSDGSSYQFKTSSSIEWTKENSIFEHK